ncbi:unnamed protein product [Clavelina lepadiformis]|uniref:Uncharacterized protein n=1 Tax=Clavelina lepadiformis TaxID=159417 RepID=A0ABP0GK99_CLALP
MSEGVSTSHLPRRIAEEEDNSCMSKSDSRKQDALRSLHIFSFANSDRITRGCEIYYYKYKLATARVARRILQFVLEIEVILPRA